MAAKKATKKSTSKPEPVAARAAELTEKVATRGKKAVARAARAVKKVGTKVTAKASGSGERPSGRAAPAATEIGVGSPAPHFELPDQDGRVVSSTALSGEPYLIYFYPRDNTSGCTRQACDFRDELAEFERLGVRVIGVSPDSAKSHRGFADKYRLDFTLLADTERALATLYGVYKMKKLYGNESMGIVRSTFLVGADGKIVAAWRGVKVPDHVATVLATVRGAG